MEIDGTTVWQHAAGDRDHDHKEVCFEWDVILSRGAGRLQNDVEAGHIVVLKHGLTDLLAIGIAGEEYSECKEFDDIDGWRLRYTRRVRWVWKADDKIKLPMYSFRMGPATQPLKNAKVIHRIKDILENVDATEDWESVRQFNFPNSRDLDAEEIANFLFAKGLPSDAIRNLLDRSGSFTQMARWYEEKYKSASEHETVCHLVVPLLQVLGWTSQRIGLEFKRVDVALFARLPRRDEHLTVVVEAKKVHGACLTAIGQAKTYAKKFPQCSRIIVTDGLRYGVYIRRANEKWPDSPKPYAYLNVNRPRSEYPIYHDPFDKTLPLKGAKEAIYAMTPEFVPAP